MSRSVKLASGSTLEVSESPFAISRNLYQAVADEMKEVKVASADETFNLFKDCFCTLLASKRIELALDECMKKAAYNGRRIDADTWEPVQAREDYLEVCFEVAKENLLPFGKNLMQRYGGLFDKLKESLA